MVTTVMNEDSTLLLLAYEQRREAQPGGEACSFPGGTSSSSGTSYTKPVSTKPSATESLPSPGNRLKARHTGLQPPRGDPRAPQGSGGALRLPPAGRFPLRTPGPVGHFPLTEPPGPSDTLPSGPPGPSDTLPSGPPGPSDTLPSGPPGLSDTLPSGPPGPSDVSPSEPPGPSDTFPSESRRPSDTFPSQNPAARHTGRRAQRSVRPGPPQAPPPPLPPQNSVAQREEEGREKITEENGRPPGVRNAVYLSRWVKRWRPAPPPATGPAEAPLATSG
ncbi:PREDICTED: proline-rich protein HaeIII subfamily 1-like [Calidris pugnax]|uniref:proline-rich protein HaeIII subfamily 1-like n=1 Tax=Calidris pugnax TaxID=198806 RepID=UPI00071E5279|nr:PREDICTED: proline-rich protein HaeIII subfamily 1-like [Calidris pugnax]